MPEVKTISVIDGEEFALEAKVFDSGSVEYFAGSWGNQPAIAVHVKSYEGSSHVVMGYDQYSLDAAEELVRVIKRGIKERNDA